MPFPTRKAALATAAAFGLLALAACGGGNNPSPFTADPLRKAIVSNDTKAITRLVKAGRDADGEFDGRTWTPLHYAAAYGKHDALSALIKADPDANVDAYTESDNGVGFSPMNYAFFDEEGERKAADIAVIRMLLGAGADPNAWSGYDVYANVAVRPLHTAARDENVASIAMLLEAGADPNAEDRGGYTAFLYAADHSSTAVVATLSEAGGKPNAKDLFYIIASNWSVTSLEAFLEANLDTNFLNAKNEDGYTALHIAARDGNAAVLAALLEAGADPNEKEVIGGNTPLHMVKSADRAAMIALIEGGADPNSRNNKGELPLATAEHLQQVHEEEERAAEAEAERERLEREAAQRRHKEEMRRIQAETAAARRRAADEAQRALDRSQRALYNSWCLANPSQCTTYQVITP